MVQERNDTKIVLQSPHIAVDHNTAQDSDHDRSFGFGLVLDKESDSDDIHDPWRHDSARPSCDCQSALSRGIDRRVEMGSQ